MDILNIKHVKKFVRLNQGIVSVLGDKEVDRFIPYYRVDRHYVVAVITASVEALSFWTKQGPETYYRHGDKLYIGLSFSNVEPEWFDTLIRNQSPLTRGLNWVFSWETAWYSLNDPKGLMYNGYRLGWSGDNMPPRRKVETTSTQPIVSTVNVNDQKVVDKWLNEVCKNLDHYFDYSDDIKVFKAGKLAYEKAMEDGRNKGIYKPEEVYRCWLKSK